MPVIQNAGQLSGLSQTQVRLPGALGSIGNLRFKGVAGATPRAALPNVFQQTKVLLSKLVFYCTAGPQVRGQQFARDQAEVKQRAVSNLLGNMTAPAGDKGAIRAVASDLARLADLVDGNMSGMPGGKEGLRTHMQSLSMLDLSAIKTGVLSQTGAHDALLSIVAPALREKAAAVLAQLTQSLDARAAGQALEQPLADAIEALSTQPAQGDALDVALDQVAYGLYALGGKPQQTVDSYVRDLPDAMLGRLVDCLAPKGQLAASVGLSQSRLETLNLVGQAVQREGQHRLDSFSARLAQQLSTDTPPASEALWEDCSTIVDQLGMGSSGAVLLKALSLPNSLTGLGDKDASDVLSRLSRSQFTNVFRTFNTQSDPANGRSSRLFDLELPVRRGNAESGATVAFASLYDAMAGDDSNRVALLANNYKIAVREMRDVGSTRVVDLPEAMRQQLSDRFGVAIDAGASDLSTTLRDNVWAPLTRELETPVPGLSPGLKAPGTLEAAVTVNGENRVFTVGEAFHKDAVQRVGLSLSVSGTDAAGRLVNTPWQGKESLVGRSEWIGQALNSLERVAGPMLQPLTHLMNQQFCAGILKGLQEMGENSPFKFPDGSTGIPIGSLSMHFDVSKQSDGGFRVDMTMHGPLTNVVKIDDDRADMVQLDPTTSWVEMKVAVLVAADGSSLREAEAPRARYNFIPLSEQ